MDNDARKTSDPDSRHSDGGLTYVAGREETSHHHHSDVDNSFAPYAPDVWIGDLAPYPVERASELTEYEEALEKSWLFFRPASMTNSAQERPQHGAPHVTAAHSGARPKKYARCPITIGTTKS